MKVLALIVFLFSYQASAINLYDCESVAPEMPGFHNMVLFGDPEDELYVYHLPLFKGDVNGHHGHVNMHVYQGLWNISLDESTKMKYAEKFLSEQSEQNPIPFFSISPRGERFKVPQMICEPGFSTQAIAAFGHVEGNPNFPSPEVLVQGLSAVTVKGEPVLAKKFDQSSKNQLTYLIFGSDKNHYMVHFLTDDENSFDQIVKVEIQNEELKSLIVEQGPQIVAVPNNLNENLVVTSESVQSKNNKFALPIGQQVTVQKDELEIPVNIKASVYFNANRDLKVNP